MSYHLAPLHLPVHTHTLANGMRVVAHPDASAPLVAVHLMYHAGSKDEHPGRTGLAHLLEHLMFEGTEHCPKGDFDLLLESVGGTNNGSTWLDRTNYYETVPSHALELPLWLERERMAHFLPVLDTEMLELQRGVVINERLQTSENRPYGRADERLYQLLFPADHPYSWPTIGYLPDLRAISLADVHDFFRSRYAPDNAVLVLAGDVEAERAFELAERYFGDLPAAAGAAALRSRQPPPAPARAPAAETMADRVSFPRWYRADAVPAYGTRDWVALDVLTYLLADGDSSRLQRALVREGQLAQDVDAWLYPTELHGIAGIVATARSGIAPERLADAADAVLAEVAERGVTDDEVLGAVRRARRDHLGGLDEIEARAEELAFATTVLGSPEALTELLDSYRDVTPDDVQRAARSYLAPGAGARLTVAPLAEEVGDAA